MDGMKSGKAPLGRKLFQFALIADTHVNEEEHKSTSTYATNGFANGRARFVFESIARLDPPPAFAVHLGDIVHPLPVLPTFEAAVERFKAIAAALRCPLHLIPGNHDVGDKLVEWMPAGTVTADHVEKYRRFFGADYFAFDYEDCRFVALNAQLINSGLAAEEEQCAWLEKEAASTSGKRWFLFLHYPPYVSDPNESGSYDNIDEPGRSWLLHLIRKNAPEGIFAGHVHNFWYDVIGTSEMYLLPATSFLRHDYSEMFKTTPVEEFGRNDTSKFGFFLVDVHEAGHVAQFVRTDGATLAENEKLPPPVPRVPAVHTRTNAVAKVGVDLRHPWAELVEIAATGVVQEFERKLARNDYPLLALWQMGVRKLRIPMQDLLDRRVRDRMRALRQMGHEFLVYSYDVPNDEAQRVLRESSGLVTSIEVVLPWTRLASVLGKLAAIRASSKVKVFVSKLRTHEDAKFDGSRFSHFINHGFHVAETHQLNELFAFADARTAIDGVSFRVSRRDSVFETFKELSRHGSEFSFKPLAHVRLASDHPGDAMDNDSANACRVAETVMAAEVEPRVAAFFDTFMDVDRGYFPRNGFIDRRCNPRLSLQVFANLHSALASGLTNELANAKCTFSESGAVFRSLAGTEVALITSASTEPEEISLLRKNSGKQRGSFIDLSTGNVSPASAGLPPCSERPRVPYLLVGYVSGETAEKADATAPIAS